MPKSIMPKSVFTTLSTVDMSKHISTVQKQKYISWSDQWSELLKHYPESSYEVHENEVGDPFTVSTMGIMVKLSVTIDGITRTINYPVLNSANKALKIDSYSYKIKEYVSGKWTGKMIEKWVEPATTFDINTAIMRALTKCIALFGLSLYIYRDEAMPEAQLIDSTQLQEIADKSKQCGFTISEVAKAWGIKTISEFHDSNFDGVIKWLEDNKRK